MQIAEVFYYALRITHYTLKDRSAWKFAVSVVKCSGTLALREVACLWANQTKKLHTVRNTKSLKKIWNSVSSVPRILCSDATSKSCRSMTFIKPLRQSRNSLFQSTGFRQTKLTWTGKLSKSTTFQSNFWLGVSWNRTWLISASTRLSRKSWKI